jgi:uncharacterized protein YdeI (BOF family)
MTITIFETISENKAGTSNGGYFGNENSNKTVVRTITISDEEIIALLGKLLASKKEVILDLLKK